MLYFAIPHKRICAQGLARSAQERLKTGMSIRKFLSLDVSAYELIGPGEVGNICYRQNGCVRQNRLPRQNGFAGWQIRFAWIDQAKWIWNYFRSYLFA